ncbi:serine/threonine-protein kinase BIK1-like [Nymphaea colorata]|nr:serine/threonine-protein kinase BIK1-like [Nymphaea colorata]
MGNCTTKLPRFICGKRTSCEKLSRTSSAEEKEMPSTTKLHQFSFNDLSIATRKFSRENLIGQGGFGYVYKGWIDEITFSPTKPGVGITVAVKKLKTDSFQGHKEWVSEVTYLDEFHHPNLVKLVGFCMEGDHRLLVYEYMQKGTLENHLFRSGAEPLSWELRIKIATDVARGLAFLHNRPIQVIHRDLKASNILLDSEFNAKLSDFGLARDGPTGDRSHVSSRIVGTQGYAAPEYVSSGHLTVKSDVYSFGVVLLEILSGRRAMEKDRTVAERNLVDWARPLLSCRKKFLRIMDTRLEGCYSNKGAYIVAKVAEKCLDLQMKNRPDMANVADILEQIQQPQSIQKFFERLHPDNHINGPCRVHPTAKTSENYKQ